MSKRLNELMRTSTNTEPNKYFAIGKTVYVNEYVLIRKTIAHFINENEAAMFASVKNKQKPAVA